jgi:two-component system, LytTR family, response regulator
MEIGCVIVDDELDACKILQGLILKYIPELKVIDIAHNVDSAIEKITKCKPDLVFLDIEMPNGNGFTLVERMRNIDFDIIFATAFDQYAIKAIKYSALDYLLKPYDLRELKQAVSKVIEKKHKLFNQQRIEVLLENINGTGAIDKIALPTHDGFIYIKMRNIVRAHSDGNYSIIHLFNGEKHVVSKSLGEIEELLPPESFFRIHRTSVVNLAYVSKYIKTEGQQVLMDDGSKLDVSHRRKDDFIALMNKRR